MGASTLPRRVAEGFPPYRGARDGLLPASTLPRHVAEGFLAFLRVPLFQHTASTLPRHVPRDSKSLSAKKYLMWVLQRYLGT